MRTYMIYYMSARRKSAKKQRSLKIEQQQIKRIKFSLIKLWTQSTKVRSLELKLWKNDFSSSAKDDKIQFFREFDPGSGWTLAACLTHSSRTDSSNTVSGGRVSNAWAICLCVRDNVWKRTLIPHEAYESHDLYAKDLLHIDELASH